MARRHPPTPRMLRPVFWVLRILGAIVMVQSSWLAWRFAESEQVLGAVVVLAVGSAFALATVLNPQSIGFRVAFTVAVVGALVLAVGVGWYVLAVLLVVVASGWILFRRRLRIKVDPESIRPLDADHVTVGAEEFVDEFRNAGWHQIGAVGFDIFGRTIGEAVLVPAEADRYAAVTDVVMSITSQIDDIRLLVTSNSDVNAVAEHVLTNDLVGAVPLELILGHQRALDVVAAFGAEPVPLVADDIVDMVVRQERANIASGIQRRDRDEPSGPIDESHEAEVRIRSWLGVPVV